MVKLVDDKELVNDVTELAKNFVSCMQHTDVKGNKSWEIVNGYNMAMFWQQNILPIWIFILVSPIIFGGVRCGTS